MAISELSHDEKYRLLNGIWPRMPESDFSTYSGLYGRYFLFMEEQMRLVQRKSMLYSIRTIDETLSILRDMRGNENQTKAEMFTTSSEQKMRSADIAARIWLTIYIQHPSNDSSICHQWPRDATLASLLNTWFTPTAPDTSHSKPRQIPDSFSIANLIQFYKFRITWTSDLLRHLEINWNYKQITIFEHAVCLRNHLQYPEGCPLPKKLIQEAIDTIKLLFPDGKETEALLVQEGRTFLGIPFGRERSLLLDNYSYWQGNISLLLDHWEEGPRGRSQIRLRPDRSNFLEYSTFWVATIVFVLTIISIVFGVASLVLAKQALDVSVRSLEVSIQSYDLSVAVACAGLNASVTLPAYCK